MVGPSMLAGFVDVAEQFSDLNEPRHSTLGLFLQPLVVLPETLHLCLQRCLVLLLLWEACKHNVFQGQAFSLCIDRTYPRHKRTSLQYLNILVVLYETDKDRRT